MFSGFTRRIPQLSIFHNPRSPPSQAALRLLNSALTGSYPPSSGKQPLNFNLEIVEDRPPTPDQLRTILSYLPPPASGAPTLPDVFISSHPTSDVHPNTIHDVANLALKNPNALKWPIVVDWNSGKAAIGDVAGVEAILENLKRRRDKEDKTEVEPKSKGWFSGWFS